MPWSFGHQERLQDAEAAVRALGAEVERLNAQAPSTPPRVDLARVQAEMNHLDTLLRPAPVRARAEMRRHLDRDLEIAPLPPANGVKRAEIWGAIKADSLLAVDQEAACLALAALHGAIARVLGRAARPRVARAEQRAR
jgi:hypothetical protein